MEQDIQIVLGNSNKKFSGVTSTMLQVLEVQRHMANVAVLGKHHLPDHITNISFWQLLKLSRNSTQRGEYLVFHARRNDEMIQALIARSIFGCKLKIAFTSTAQRHHSTFTKWLMSKMDRIITTCSAADSYLKKSADAIIPHGIDTHRYSPSNNRKEAWQGLGFSGERAIGIFGRVRPSKGIDLFVEAAIQLLSEDQSITAVICGETTGQFKSFQRELEQKINAAGLQERIIFTGKQPFSNLPRYFRSMSTVVAASRNEGFGLTVLEAMASGTPVVATDAGAWKDIIENGVQGYCVKKQSAQSIYKALKKVLAGDIEKMGAAARLHVEQNYTVKKEAEALTELLLSLA